MKHIKIEEEELYTLQDIVLYRIFPWANSFAKVRGIVQEDSKKKGILKPVITGNGTNTRYYFKGKNIIKFINLVEAGTVKL